MINETINTRPQISNVSNANLQAGASENLQSRYSKISQEFKELLAVQDNLLTEINSYWIQLNKSCKQFNQLKAEKNNLEQQLQQIIEKLNESHFDLSKTLQNCENIIKQFKKTRYVNDFKFAESFNLSPLVIGSEYSPNKGKIEQYHSNTVHFTPFSDGMLRDLISMSDLSFITFYDELSGRIKFEKQPAENNAESTTLWKVYVDNKPYIDVKLVVESAEKDNARIEVAWNFDIACEDVTVANSLLFSAITLEIKTYYFDAEGKKYDVAKLLCCQLLKPEKIIINPLKIKQIKKTKLQPRQEIANIALTEFDFVNCDSRLKSWLVQTLAKDAEIEIKNFYGDANFEYENDENKDNSTAQNSTSKSTELTKLPKVVLTSNSREIQSENIAGADCSISIIKDDAELILFKNKF
ncbi:MAG: hypothetical protein LBB88_10655 [Planctomycetaceae bacterium]|jgi:uncharacterized protein (UPF0335 family)|nr:hypothetical protein [Planctomycetaceae bacterium]